MMTQAFLDDEVDIDSPDTARDVEPFLPRYKSQ